MRLYKPKGCDVWWYDFSYHGSRVRQSSEQTDKYLAGLVANDALQKARDNGTQALLRTVPILEKFAAEFLTWVEETQSFGEHGKRYYKGGWDLLKDTALAKKRMDQISNHDCEMLKFPGSNVNANKALRTLRRMFSKAKEIKQMFGDLPKISLREEWARSIVMSEADAVLIDSKMKEGDPRDAFRIIRSTGMNPLECFEMRWEYIDFIEGVYLVPKGKRKARQRAVSLNFPPFDCMDILRRRHMVQGSPTQGWVFPTDRSRTGHMYTINRAFNLAKRAAGLPDKMVLYTARHAVGTAVADVSTQKSTMQVLGHSSYQTSMRYQHPDLKAIAERLWAKSNAKERVQ